MKDRIACYVEAHRIYVEAQRKVFVNEALGTAVWLLAVALLAVMWLVSALAAGGFVLQLFEIRSVYNRLLPHWSAADFAIAWLLASAVKIALRARVDR